MRATDRRSPWRALAAPPVLMYHFFGEPRSGHDPDAQFVGERSFREQLVRLLDSGWRPLDLDGYLSWWASGAASGRRAFLVTIDDAHRSVVDIAAPVLAELGVPSVLFVPSALIDGTVSWSDDYLHEPIASAAELRDLAAAGMELGVHGYDHTRMVAMTDGELRVHAHDARVELERLVGVRARAFAYPYGTHDAAARRAVADAGYEVAFAVAREHGALGRWRICVDGDDGLRTFRFKLTPAYAALSLAAGRTWQVRHLVRDGVAALRGATTTAAARR